MKQVAVAILEMHPSYISAANSSPSPNIPVSITAVLLAAILGFVSAYSLEQIKRRREPRKQLSWEVKSEQAQLEISSDIKEGVEVLYRNIPVQNLTAATYMIANTGNRAVKNEQVRFNFGEEVSVLEHSLDPEPEPELEVTKVTDHGLGNRNYVYRLGLVEVGQQVRFVFVLASRSVVSPAPPFARNDEGDVRFLQRGTERIVADQEHMRPFFIALFAFIVVPIVLDPLVEFLDFAFRGPAVAVIELILLIPILPHIKPVSRLVQQLVARYLAPRESAITRNTVNGGDFRGPVIQGRNFSGISFPPETGNNSQEDSRESPES